jgi:hypothetical protein
VNLCSGDQRADRKLRPRVLEGPGEVLVRKSLSLSLSRARALSLSLSLSLSLAYRHVQGPVKRMDPMVPDVP